MIGYYAHHVGAGHLHRAAAVAAHLGRGMTVLTSADCHVSVNQVRLARDDDPPAEGDVTAGHSLHWVPVGHNGLRDRTSQIVGWTEEQRCSVLVSDVSVEVLLLTRLLSIPPVAVAMRGRRLDRPHALGYDVSCAIIAPWPRLTHGRWPQRWLDKTVWVGPVSRFDGRARVPGRCQGPGRCVVLMLGRGGDSMTETALSEAAAVPDTHWHLLGRPPEHPEVSTAEQHGGSSDRDGRDRDSVDRGSSDRHATVERAGWLADPWPVLCRADVVVTAPGDAAIADIAAAGRPLIVVPQHRPFDEQQAQAAALVRHWLCLSVPTWPDRQHWPELLDRAQSLGGAGWSAYYDGLGSARMAAELLEIADRGRGWQPDRSDALDRRHDRVLSRLAVV
ncbi:MAG: hypothetical protein M3313_11545 [Actinomycetota bacterium]|nr:hypothetical protein [Actinomycetota bacterium]